MTNKELMNKGELYIANDQELISDYLKAKRLCQEYNLTKYDDFEGRYKIIKKLFGKTKNNFNIMPPLYCDYGCNIEIGENFYSNYDLIILDVNKVTFGDNVFLAPRVSIYTAGHPIDKDIRNEQLEFGQEIKIGNDVWIGGSVTILPGVTIGNIVVIGAGSVVTKDIPSNVVAVGNPCRVLREVGERDKKYFYKNEEIDWEIIT